ncbi:MAG: GntR family transcriptional regulator [Acidimicrobiales bacterium]
MPKSKVGRIEPGDLLADRAYQRLRDEILSGRLAPGTPLSVPELARQFSISRSPVREAVQRLIYDGLAAGVPYRGAVVRSVAVNDLRHLYRVRELLEGLAARLATEHLDDGRLNKIKRTLDAHKQVVESRDEARHVELDVAFHRCIREACGNPYLNEILENIQGKAHLAQFQLWRGEHGPQVAVDEHAQILRALTEGDPDRADAAARAHVARLRMQLAETQGVTEGSDHAGSA